MNAKHVVRRRCANRARIAMLALLAACGSGTDAGSNGSQISTAQRPANLGEVLQIRGDTVEVRMDEYLFAFPTLTLPAGRIVFKVQNLGFEYHNLEISQDHSILWRFDRDLAPGQIGFLDVTLEPGEYYIICAVSGHDDKGMTANLTVVDGDSSTDP
jgi:uncharacterized cupredoxin-like copper-binding protein